MKYLYLLAFHLLTIPAITVAQTSKDFSVLVTAEVYDNSPNITVKWQKDTNATAYRIWRKLKSDNSWGSPLHDLTANDTSYIDVLTASKTGYEYKLEKTSTINGKSFNAFGYIYAGSKVPITENRGKLILLVDADFEIPLATEINRLKMDITGDGWQVIKLYINKNESVKDVKQKIVQIYNADPENVKALFLLGHIPVPYSGEYAIDHHIPDHLGAWPADVYYGSMNENGWTDSDVDNTGASRVENRNIPGDGKFDQDVIPGDVKLQIGRVDFFNLPLFKLTETDLMKRYLDKDHNWRVKNIHAKNKAVIEDNFGGMSGEAFAASAFKSFTPMFGDSNVFVQDYLNSVTKDTFLWSYGAGGGSFTNVGGVATTNDFATKKINTVFTMLFGSYFGDWDSKDNVLRAPLAAEGMTLTSVWSGRPQWIFHHMALGENIGYSTFVNQNDYVNYFRLLTYYFPVLQNTGDRLTTPALMGDPTLRMHVVAPPEIKRISSVHTTPSVEWKQSAEAEEYYVYRTTNLQLPFERIAVVSATDSFYVDYLPLNPEGDNYYMVRAAKEQHTASGSYINLSQGSIDSVSLPNGITKNKTQQVIQVYPNPSLNGNFVISLPGIIAGKLQVKVSDVTGRVIYNKEIQNSGNNKIELQMQDKRKGIYILQVSSKDQNFTQRLIYR